MKKISGTQNSSENQMDEILRMECDLKKRGDERNE